jgi:soluble lytic murein transglycosylase-like protein
MAPLLVLVALLGMAVPRLAAAVGDDVYSFVDGEGVIHVTNVPLDRRFRRVPGLRTTRDGVHRIVITGRASSRRAPPALLRRTTLYDEHIRAAAERHGIAPPLLKAVMAVESNFDAEAVSHKGATGLMQLMPATAREVYVTDLLDPAQNIDGGARYLRRLQDEFRGDLVRMLAAYNAGPEAVRRARGNVPPIPETQAYVRKVIERYDSYMRGG